MIPVPETLSVSGRVTAAQRTNLNEEVAADGELSVQNGQVRSAVRGYEIVTIKLLTS